jgi:hypothetical protein
MQKQKQPITIKNPACFYRYDRYNNDFCIEGAKAPLFFVQ